MRIEKTAALSAAVLLILAASASASTPEVNLVPWPQALTLTGGDMALTARSRVVYSEASLLPLAEVLADEIEAVTRLDVKVASDAPSAGDISLKLTSDPRTSGEAYRVNVAANATVEAANYNAVAMGSVTLLQAITQDGSSFGIPNMTVTDQPDAEYRGYMVDVARQYHSIETLKDIVIMCRLYKMRYLQLHLTDDQAFTFPTAAYPTLAAHGGDYSMAEMKDLVAFADKRGVILIPELEVPAHASCFTSSMPELFASPTNGIINFADPAVWDAIKTLIDEMCDVFQSTPYFHLGADEANIWGLSKDPEFAAAFETYGVDGIEGLFNYFITELNDKVKSCGKKTIVWEGFNYGKTGNAKMDTDIAVMMFDNYKHPERYMDAGHEVINASWFPLYIVGGSGFGVPANLIYDWDRYQFGNYTDPFPRRYDSLYWKNVSPTPDVPGAQMCSWEMPEKNEIPFARLRIAPYADRIWNPENSNGFEHFQTRCDSTDTVLDYLLADREPPATPTRVGASDGLYQDKIRVGWAPGGNYPVKLSLYKHTRNDPSTATLMTDELSKKATSYEDTDVVDGQTYYYWLKAKNNWGWSGFSATARGRTGTSSDLPSVYEPFNYSQGVPIDGEAGGAGFAGPWSVKNSNGTVTVDSMGLTYPGLATKGGALRFVAGKDKPSFDLARPFKGQAGHDMSVVWFSFLIRPEKVADGHAYIMLNGQFGGMGIGKKWGNGFGFHGVSSVKLENDQTYFVVARYDCRSGNDVAHFWVNPSLDQAPTLDSASATYAGGDIGLGNSVDFSIQGYGKGIYIYDEIRIGATWAQVNGDLSWEHQVETVETRQLDLRSLMSKARQEGMTTAYASVSDQVISAFLLAAQHDHENTERVRGIFKTFAYYDRADSNEADRLPFRELKACLDVADHAMAELRSQLNGKVTLANPPDLSRGDLELSQGYYRLDGRTVFPSSLIWMPKVEGFMRAFGRIGEAYYQLGQMPAHGKVDDRVLARAVASLQNQCRLNAAALVFFVGHAAAGWMKRDHPEILEGARHFTQYDIDSPLIRTWIKALCAGMLPGLSQVGKNRPMVHLLANEPHFATQKGGWRADNGLSDFTLEKYRAWIAAKYKTAHALNDMYGTAYASLDQVTVDIPIDPKLRGSAVWYDWCRFNMDRVNNWFAFLKHQVQTHDRGQNPVTIKMLGFTLSTAQRDHGLDIETLTKLQDIPGADLRVAPHDAIFYGKREAGQDPETDWRSRYAYDWVEQSMYLDFTKSLCPDKLFYDSEWHGFGAVSWRHFKLRRDYVRSALWLAFSHGMGAIKPWLWGRGADGALRSSADHIGELATQPIAVDAYGRVMKELNAHAEHVKLVVPKVRRVMIYYCEEAAIQDGQYPEDFKRIYEALKLLNLSVGFAIGSTLGDLDVKRQVLMVPPMQFISDHSLMHVTAFQQAGGRVVLCGPAESFLKNEMGVARAAHELKPPTARVSMKGVLQMVVDLGAALAPHQPDRPMGVVVTDLEGRQAYGVIINQNRDPGTDELVLLLNNVSRKDRKVMLPGGGKVMDLMTQLPVSRALILRPCEVRLLSQE